jgi:hypothetical protein
MILIDNKKISFVHSPKCGGTSIRAWLQKVGKNNFRELSCSNHNYHSNIPETLKHNNIERENLGFVFTIVRNPWAREFSNYYQIQKNRSYPEKIQAIKETATDFSHWIELVEGNSFKYLYDDCNNKHAQLYWTQQCDMIIKLEELKQKFNIIEDMFDSKEKLINKNVQFSNENEWKNNYNKETIDIVYKAHQDDIDKYEYDF